MKRGLAWLAVLITLVTCSSAANAGNSATTEFQNREPVAVPTYCDTNWDDPRILGYVWVAGPNAFDGIHLSPTTCAELRAGPGNGKFFEGVSTLYHEWVHQYFRDLDEGDTECVSLFFLRYELRHKWGLSTKQAQVIYDNAWDEHLMRSVIDGRYRGWCTYPQPDPVP